jgi:hypothetical protein
LPIQQNPLGLLLKGTSVVAVNSVLRPWLLQQIARQMALSAARYEIAKQAMVRGGGGGPGPNSKSLCPEYGFSWHGGECGSLWGNPYGVFLFRAGSMGLVAGRFGLAGDRNQLRTRNPGGICPGPDSAYPWA